MGREGIKDIQLTENQILADAYDKIVVKMHLQKQQKDHSIFMICGTDPKVGATSASIFLARGLARSGKKVLLLDADMRKSTKMYGDGCKVTLAQYLTEDVAVEHILYPTNYNGMDVLPGGLAPSPVQLLCSDKMRTLLGILREYYDFIVIDIPSAGAASDANAILGYVDEVVLVAAPEHTYKKQIIECYETYEKYGAQLLGVIVNRVDRYGYHDYMKNSDYYVGDSDRKAGIFDYFFKRLGQKKDKTKEKKAKRKDTKVEKQKSKVKVKK